MSKACIHPSDLLIFQHKRRVRVIVFIYASSEVHFCSIESQTFYRSIVTAGWFSKSRALSASVSFLSSPPLLALLLAPFLAPSLTLVPHSLFLNRAETLATQAKSDFANKTWAQSL